MTTATAVHEPVIGFGKTNEKTGIAAVLAEGSQAFAFNNAGGGKIHVGDIVLCSDESDDDNQYLGEVTAQDDTGVLTTLGLQNVPGTSLKLWEPTTRVRFVFGEASGGQRPTHDDGTSLILTRGNTGISVQSADASELLAMSFNPVQQGDYDLWTTFRQDDRSFGTDAMSLIWFDNRLQLSRVADVRVVAGSHTMAQLGRQPIDAFSETFFIANDDTYVTS